MASSSYEPSQSRVTSLRPCPQPPLLDGKAGIFTLLLFHSTFTHLSRDLEMECRKLLISLYLYSPLLTPLLFIFNRKSISQAGRRRFEPGLPLQLFNNLGIKTHDLSLQSLH
jgi:hypothetical protein